MSVLDVNFQWWFPHFSCLKVKRAQPAGTDQIPASMGDKVHTLFTPELNLCCCDNITGSKRGTQRSKAKERSRIHFRAMSFICSFSPAEEASVSASVCRNLVQSVQDGWRLLRCICCAKVVFCCDRIRWECNVLLFTMNGDKRRLTKMFQNPMFLLTLPVFQYA